MRRVGEGPRRGGEIALEADLHLDARTGLDPDPGEVLGGQVELHVAVAVDVEDGCADPRLTDRGLGNHEPPERRRVERGTELPSSTPLARCAAAGEKMSRPWKVCETRSSM